MKDDLKTIPLELKITRVSFLYISLRLRPFTILYLKVPNSFRSVGRVVVGEVYWLEFRWDFDGWFTDPSKGTFVYHDGPLSTGVEP